MTQKLTAAAYWQRLPDLSWSHLLLRIPLAVVFLQQGFSKLPYDPAGGDVFGLLPLVWWVVVYGEIAAGVGLLVGGLASINLVKDIPPRGNTWRLDHKVQWHHHVLHHHRCHLGCDQAREPAGRDPAR